MIKIELLELQRVIEAERMALMKGAVEEILKWSSHKIRLLRLLEDKKLTPDELELLQELFEKNEKNRKLIEAGLNFVQEAYQILTNFLVEKEFYGKVKESTKATVLSKNA